MSIHRKEIASIREDYSRSQLDESIILDDPIAQFDRWLQEAISANILEPTAMVLSSVNIYQQPSSRVVLLKDVSSDGFTFFTNYESRKGEEMATNARVCLLFFWGELQRQVRIEGTVEKLSAADSDQYFQSRPRGSQIGALASPQSKTLSSRKELEDEVSKVTAQYGESEPIARPEHWGGYLVIPTRLEFWQGRSSRLHDRLQYDLVAGVWQIKRLAP